MFIFHGLKRLNFVEYTFWVKNSTTVLCALVNAYLKFLSYRHFVSYFALALLTTYLERYFMRKISFSPPPSRVLPFALVLD